MTGSATQTVTVRARILNDVRTSSTSAASRALAAEHLDAPHEALATLRVRQLVLACRGVGDWHARKLLGRARVDGDRRLGALTARERAALVAVLAEPWPYEATS